MMLAVLQLGRRKLLLLLHHLSNRRRLSSTNAKKYVGNGILGIIREDYNVWERRSPLSPLHVSDLIKKHKCKVIVQPCMRRIYSDKEYAAVGAAISNDLSTACLVLGIKAIREENIQPNKSYMFFSHVIKAQPKSMPLLDTVLGKNARLFDYECITQEGRDDLPRLVAFGKYAGMAGMIDGLQGIGVRLLAEGVSSPFLNVPFSFMHNSLQEVTLSLRRTGDSIRALGLQQPLIFAFTGNGNVSTGIREIFEQLPHEYVTLGDLPTLSKDIAAGKRSQYRLYAIKVETRDMVRLKGAPGANNSSPFNKAHYYSNPGLYEGCFHENVLPYVNILVNGMYWDQKFPRLVTKQQIRELRNGKGNYNLKACLDITCDIGGSVEFLTKSTTINNPFFSYIPETDESLDSVGADSILMLGVDILPTELPKDSSDHFGRALMPFLPPLLNSKGSSKPGEDDLPPEIKRSCIASHGEMLPKWNYIQRLRQTTEQLTAAASASTVATATSSNSNSNTTVAGSSIELRGHLFDTGLINKVLDYLEKENVESGVVFRITNCMVRPNTTSGAVPTVLLLHLTQNEGDAKSIDRVISRIGEIIKNVPLAECTLHQLLPPTVNIRKQRRVLLFGSGRVARPVIKLFKTHDDIHVKIATDSESQASELIDEMNSRDSVGTVRGDRADKSASIPQMESRASFVKYTFPDDNESLLSRLVSSCDVIISLLPATMHVPLAREAIRHKKHLVTASYVSQEMRALHMEAKAAGVALVNEVGLDPGIDHLLIMQSIDDIKSRGGVIEEVVSLCGGLPDPVAADNPLLYKISWSPRGALIATTNSARYLQGGVEINVAGEHLLRSAMPSDRFPTMKLEVIPNRDSLAYRELYGVPNVTSIYRGTLRYVGWANVFNAFKALDLLAASHKTKATNWRELMLERAGAVVGRHNEKSRRVMYESNSSSSYTGLIEQALYLSDVADVPAAINAFDWLGLSDEEKASKIPLTARTQTPIDNLCALLESRLAYDRSEKDMVAMFHSITGRFPSGAREVHTSRLLAFGEPGGVSAMSSTVGYTTAIAAELLLNGTIKDTGCIIPTHRSVYAPMLARLKQFNITWTEAVRVIPGPSPRGPNPSLEE